MSNEEKSMKSPYYLSPSDNPGTMITPVLLTGENYEEWASELENALRAKRKIGFINGSHPMPDETKQSDEAEMWRTCNSMIVGWIRASISAPIRLTVTFTADAYKLWSDLQKRFSIRNSVRIHQLKSELASCKQEGSTIQEYFGKLLKKWEELINYEPPLKCTCGVADQITKKSEEEKVHQFLMGLDESRFGNVCTNIIGLEDLPDINTVYQHVVREVRRLSSLCLETKQDVVGFFTKTEHNGDNTSDKGIVAAATQSRGSTVCSHCGKNGHEKRDCWQIIGYPKWVNKRSSGGGERGLGSGLQGRGRGRLSQSCTNAAYTATTTSVPTLTPEQ